VTPEGLIKSSICDYLSILRRRGVLDFWLSYSTGIFDPIRKIMRKKNSKHDRNGISDISLIIKIVGPRGTVLGLAGFIEVKAGRNTLSEAQEEFREACKLFGAFHCVAYSVQDVRNALRSQLGIDI
jgi:hypothetical protein